MVEMDENVLINSSYLPNAELVEMIRNLEVNQAIFKNEDVPVIEGTVHHSIVLLFGSTNGMRRFSVCSVFQMPLFFK